MKVAALTTLALAGGAYAQAQNLTAALASNPQLSGLAGLIGMVQLPANLTNVTLLAPSNQAISAVPNATLQALAANSAMLNQVLSYHILMGNYSTIPNETFIPTMLTQLVSGGQRVHALPSGNTTMFYSGLLANSSTVNSTIQFNGGSIHIINALLTPPVNVSSTAVALNLTSAVGAITAANLGSTLDTTQNLTLFVPNNAAFRAISSVLTNISTETLTSVLQYHAVNRVIYSTGITNGTQVPTLGGMNLTARVVNGSVYINNARVVLPNVLTSNGVIHVIDAVLNPMNTTATGSGSANSTVNAFPGASSGSSDVLTSGVPTPTSSINTGAAASAATSRAASSSSSGIAAYKAVETGAMAVAALFGAVLNL